MRTSPPLVFFGSWSNIRWVKLYLDFLTPFPLGFSSSIEPGVDPWKMYFSPSGMCAKTSGARLKFLATTDFGVCATDVGQWETTQTG